MLPTKACLQGRSSPIPDAPAKDAKHYVIKGGPIYPPFPEGSEMISVGMGCFWCSESLFWKMEGVLSTHVGYQMGTTPNPTYREVCSGRTNHNEVTRIVYDPKVCPLSKILKVFFETHDSTQVLGQGNDRGTQYRTGLYYYSDDQKTIIEAHIKVFQDALSKAGIKMKIATEVMKAELFYYAEDYHQQYDAKPGNREYCGLRPLNVEMPSLSESKGPSVEAKKSTEILGEGRDPKAEGAAMHLFQCATVRNKSGTVTPVSSLNGKVIAVYHSAHWCSPCKEFTPKLKALYDVLTKEEKDGFEIVWKSYDRNEDEYKEYLNQMPWLTSAFADRKKMAKNANKFIPSLVIYDRNGKGVTKDGVSEVSQAVTLALTKSLIRTWCGLAKKNGGNKISYPIVGPDSIMAPKANGTTDTPPVNPLRWGCNWKKANQICCFNRHYAENSGYFKKTAWSRKVDKKGVTTYYDSVSGKPTFRAPIGRTFNQFLVESGKHGWPSFRDEEVVWENVRCLKNGEVVSLDGTHLGHNLPDHNGNRYCINLVSVAGLPKTEVETKAKREGGGQLVSLKKYIVKGHVDYEGLGSEEGRSLLGANVAYVANSRVSSMEKREMFCFYLNAYNILTLKHMLYTLDNNPDYEGHTSLKSRYAFFVKATHSVGGKEMSLKSLEDGIIRKIGDPRIHAYLNCASMGCPYLSETWVTPKNVDKVLDECAHDWISNQGAAMVTNTTVEGAGSKAKAGGALVSGEESIMSKKGHGTTEAPPQDNLRWGCDFGTADKVCCYNRHYAEPSGYFMKNAFINYDAKKKGPITFYDSITGLPLFVAPKGRTWAEFIDESENHGWPSFRDEEVVWKDVRILENGEAVSTAGTHLGHNLPDSKGNRYCINLVSVAGHPDGKAKAVSSEEGDRKGEEKGVANVMNAILEDFAPKHVKDRRYRLSVYKRCFVGKDLVDWLVMQQGVVEGETSKTGMLTRDDATALAQDLMHMGVFQHVLGEQIFEDKYLFYRFEKDGGATPPKGNKKKVMMLLVSSIFKWGKQDFAVEPYGGVFQFIRKYHDKLKEMPKLDKITDKDVTFRYQMWDWRANSLPNAKRLKSLLFKEKE